MKFINKLKTVFITATLASTMIACNSDKLTDMNVDPDNPSEVPASYLLTSGQKYSMENVWDAWANGRFGLVYSQYWAQQAYPSESRFRYRDSSVNGQWIDYFAAGGLKDLKQSMVISKSILDNPDIVGDSKDVASNQYAVAQITRVWLMHLVTDIWGPVPYTEALQGGDAIAPKYDTQESIYSSLLAELDEAQQMLKTTSSVDGDVIFNGKVAKWEMFASSLKLRIALRMADKDISALQNVVAAGGFMTANDDNATLLFGSAPHNNPLNEDRKTRADFGASNTMVDLLKSTNDPRLGLYFDPTVESVEAGSPEYVGVIYGLDDNTANNLDLSKYSQPSAATLYEKAPGIYMSYSEVCFALSEAALRGVSTPKSAVAHYEDGVRASMEFWNEEAALAGMTRTVSGDEITAFIAANPLDEVNWKVSLGIQKWVALYMQGHQGWIEWRRLDFGILRSPIAGHDRGNGEIPVRRPYPTDEQTLNFSSYTSGVELLNSEAGFSGSNEFQGDNLNNPVWWDTAKGTQIPVDENGNPQ